MKNKLTSNELIDTLRQADTLTRQDLAKILGVSMPTALQKTNEFLQLGLLIEMGEMNSTGGRKAKCLQFNRNLKKTLGIDIYQNRVKLALVDFGGSLLCEKTETLKFEDTPEWYGKLKDCMDGFLQDENVDKKDILSAGLSFPGIIDEERGMIVKSHILRVENLSLDRFQEAIAFPLTAHNDANCATYTELTGEKTNFLYLSLNDTVGGGIVLKGDIHEGDAMQAGEIGHMILIPGGKHCYCGKQGCADPYLSPKTLYEPDERIEDFFLKVEAGEDAAKEKWDRYLEYLAIFVTNLRMLLNTDIIVGGEIGKHIDPYMDTLRGKMQKYDLFARTINYIYPCTEKKSVCAIGAARFAIKKYESLVLGD